MDIEAVRFEDRHPNEVGQMRRLVLEYVQHLQSLLRGTASAIAPVESSADAPMNLETTDDGYPILPSPWDASQYTKADLEKLLTNYLSAHYSDQLNFMPSGRR